MRKILLSTVSAISAVVALAGVAQAQTATPAPGTINVTLGGRFRAYAGSLAQGDANTASAKTNDAGIYEYLRLYPGFDGLTNNSIKYGVATEIRQDNTSTSANTTIGAGGGANGSVSQQNRALGALYVRRDYGYIGTKELGTVRIGTIDGASSLVQVGTFDSGPNAFNDGGWNGDYHYAVLPALNLNWAFASSGSYYATSKIVYLSPKIAGFDLVASFEPSTDGANIDSGSYLTADSSSASLMASNNTKDAPRRRNTYDIAGRYTGKFADVAVIGTASYIGSGKVDYNGAYVLTSGTPAVTSYVPHYQGLSVADFGLSTTYAGLTLAGNYQTGKFNGEWALLPTGYKDSTAWSFGTKYAIGPIQVGASYYGYTSAGSVSINSVGASKLGERQERGISAGGTYTLSKNLSLYLTYLYGQRQQNGYDFITNAADVGHNKVVVQGAALGTSFTW